MATVALSSVPLWTILSPVSPAPEEEVTSSKGPFKLGRSVRGVRVGLEIDYTWVCYPTVIDEWERLLRADGAEPTTLWVSDGAPRNPNEVRADVEAWSQLIDCGVVGLGN